MAVVPDNPRWGPMEENLIVTPGDGQRCKHLRGDIPGEYSCFIHNREYYHEIPCHEFGQIENDPNSVCRIGMGVFQQLGKDVNGYLQEHGFEIVVNEIGFPITEDSKGFDGASV